MRIITSILAVLLLASNVSADYVVTKKNKYVFNIKDEENQIDEDVDIRELERRMEIIEGRKIKKVKETENENKNRDDAIKEYDKALKDAKTLGVEKSAMALPISTLLKIDE